MATARSDTARPAVGAVDERVAIAAVGGVKQFAAALLARSRVGREKNSAAGGLAAGDDDELGVAGRSKLALDYPRSRPTSGGQCALQADSLLMVPIRRHGQLWDVL